MKGQPERRVAEVECPPAVFSTFTSLWRPEHLRRSESSRGGRIDREQSGSNSVLPLPAHTVARKRTATCLGEEEEKEMDNFHTPKSKNPGKMQNVTAGIEVKGGMRQKQ